MKLDLTIRCASGDCDDAQFVVQSEGYDEKGTLRIQLVCPVCGIGAVLAVEKKEAW